MSDSSASAGSQSFLRSNPPAAALLEAWAEHRPHVAFATALFVVGVVVGAALAAAGYDVLAFIQEVAGEHPFEGIEEEDLTPWFFVANNSIPFLMAIAGAITLGLFTAYIMVFNGIVVGNLGWFVAGEAGIGFLVVGLAPHGIFELPALFVAAGVGFRLLHRAGQRVLGRRESLFSKAYLYRTLLLVLVAWLLLVVAAFVESYVTGALLEALFGDGLDEQATAANDTASAVATLLVDR